MMKEANIAKAKSFRELKAERYNRLENWKLDLRLKLMEKEKGHHDYLNMAEKKNIMRQIEDIHRTTGYSPFALKPLSNDRALNSSPYFTSGRKLSEKALSKWRNTEEILERELRLSDIELHKRQQQQLALIKLLVDLGVIADDAEISTQRPKTAGSLEPSRSQNQQGPRKQRPLTADVVHSTPKVSQRGKLRATSAVSRLQRSDSTQNQSKETDLDDRNSQSVKTELSASRAKLSDRESKIFSKTGALRRPASMYKPKDLTKPSFTRSKSVAFDEHPRISSEEGEDDEDEILPVAPQQARWKRELLQEAPPGLQHPKGGVQVRLAISKSAMKKQLNEMIEENEKDVGRLIRAEAQRRERSRQAVMQTMSRITEFQGDEPRISKQPDRYSASIMRIHEASDSEED